VPTKTKPLATQLDKGRRPDIEAELTEKYHVKWSYLSQVPISGFDLDRSLHNQARFEPIDEKTVDLYTEAVRRGDQFPAVLAYKASARGRYVIIDGNHRLSAHIRAESPIDVYEVERTTDPRTIALLTFALNTRHGRPTTEAERVQQALYLVDNGASIDHASAAVNIAPRVLKKALARQQADARADEVGMPRNEWDSLGATVKARLLNIATDEGFGDAARLAFAAKMDANEVFDLVALLNATKSGTRQRAIVKHHRDMMQERIQAGGGGVLATADRRKMGPKQRIGMALSQALALPDDDNVIVQAYAAAERGDAAKRMLEASERLARIAKALTAK